MPKNPDWRTLLSRTCSTSAMTSSRNAWRQRTSCWRRSRRGSSGSWSQRRRRWRRNTGSWRKRSWHWKRSGCVFTTPGSPRGQTLRILWNSQRNRNHRRSRGGDGGAVQTTFVDAAAVSRRWVEPRPRTLKRLRPKFIREITGITNLKVAGQSII